METDTRIAFALILVYLMTVGIAALVASGNGNGGRRK